MKLKHPSPAVSLAAVAVAGIATALAGVYLLAGLPVTLIAGGLAATVAALLVDAE